MKTKQYNNLRGIHIAKSVATYDNKVICNYKKKIGELYDYKIKQNV